jgi:TolA-binding protein
MDGVRSFEAADYDGALARFEEAYALEPMPEMLFNVARCHEKLGDSVSACAVYEQIVASVGIGDGIRDAAVEQIGKLGC